MRLRFHRYEYPSHSIWWDNIKSPAMLQSFNEKTHEWEAIDLVTEKVYQG